MAADDESDTDIYITAPNGVTWTRRRGGTSTGQELLQALEDLTAFYSDLSRRWNWWQEGRREQEHDRLMRIMHEWDNGAPDSTEEEAEAFAQAETEKLDRRFEEDRKHRADLVARSYDKDRKNMRLELLRAESDAAFFTHVIEAAASVAQRDEAERRVADRQTRAEELRRQLGDPEEVINEHGSLPAERREWTIRSHMEYWRHPRLREWETTDRQRFDTLLNMPMPDSSAMCSECETPTEWHEYDLSLRLFHAPPPPDSQAARLARLMPGWWERCPGCTAYNIEHRWGGSFALPDFSGEQYVAMLPPLLRTIFASTEAKPKPKKKRQPKPKPLAVLSPGPIDDVMAQLADAQAKYPTAQVHRGQGGKWELWPS